jgi:multiple sugar transport system permease protein
MTDERIAAAIPSPALDAKVVHRSRVRELSGVALFLAPALSLLALFMFYPIGSTIWMSLNRVDQFGSFNGFVGLGNYRDLFADPSFRGSLVRTIVWTVAVVAITTMVALWLAVTLNERFRLRPIARGLLLLPWAASLVVTTLLWSWMAHPDFGALNHLLSTLGISHKRIEWLADPSLSFPLMIWIAIWVSIPPTTLMLLAGLQSIDPSLYEAAALDGSRRWWSFWDITLPLLRPIFAVSILLNVIFVFNSFPIIWVLTEGGPAGETDTLVTYLYKQGFRLYAMGSAAAVSVVIFAILLAFAVVHTRVSWRNVLGEEGETRW